MINLEKFVPKKGVLMGTTFRGLSDSCIEEIYLYLFHQNKGFNIPSVVKVDDPKPELKKFFADKERFLLICYSKNHVIQDAAANDNLEDVESSKEVFVDDDQVFWYIDSKSKQDEPVLIRLSLSGENIYFSACSFNQDALGSLYREIKDKFAKKFDYKEELYFGILYQTGNNLQVRNFPLDDDYSMNLDVGLNYGAEFKKHHDSILDKISQKKRGLYIFHGEPGTGKTTYIKHLASQFGGKRNFIFIPTTYVDTLVSPSLIPILLDNKDSVLVLEDAEKAVVSRDNGMGNESLVSSLLNIGDGILGSMLNLSLIVTFNTSKDKVDAALLRKGRLLYEHKFTSLTQEDSQTLLNNLKKDYTAKGPMTLAEIYNIESSNNHQEEKKNPIGFKP